MNIMIFGKTTVQTIAILGAVLTFVFTATEAQAQNKSGLTGAEIEEALEEAGLSPTMAEDAATGAPVARAQAGPIQFWVRGLDCAGGECSTLVFFANWELGRPVTGDDYKRINRYNDRQVFGRAYVIEAQNAIGVDHVIEMDGGVSMDNVASNISRWADVISAFLSNFRDNSAGS